MGEVLGIDPRWTMTLPAHGRMSGMGIIEAVLALATGQANYVALLYANIGRSRRVNYGGDEMPSVWDPWGFTSPGAAHAMMFRRHMELLRHDHAPTRRGVGRDPPSRLPQSRRGDEEADHDRRSRGRAADRRCRCACWIIA